MAKPHQVRTGEDLYESTSPPASLSMNKFFIETNKKHCKFSGDLNTTQVWFSNCPFKLELCIFKPDQSNAGHILYQRVALSWIILFIKPSSLVKLFVKTTILLPIWFLNGYGSHLVFKCWKNGLFVQFSNDSNFSNSLDNFIKRLQIFFIKQSRLLKKLVPVLNQTGIIQMVINRTQFVPGF
jgi:hypothetical protein